MRIIKRIINICYYFFQFYCLPDNYEVIDSSLDDIKVSLNLNN